MLVVMDIDGTVADTTHRQAFVDDPDKYNSPDLVIKDAVVPGASAALSEFTRLGYTVVFVTSRAEALRDVTGRWLLENLGVSVDDRKLVMRTGGNLLTPAEYKHEAAVSIHMEIDRNRGCLFIDDDAGVCSRYQELGATLKAPECWGVLFPKQVRS